MSKLFKTFLSFFFLSLFSLSLLQAAPHTWIGGSGKWHIATNWDLGTVPTAADDVIIPSGSARILKSTIAYAKSVEVDASGRLYIYKTGELHISGAKNKSGLKNSGRVYVIGKLFIDDVGHTDSSFNTDGIYNSSKIYTYDNSEITIDDVDGSGIYNNGTGYFSAKGEINISDIQERGIYNLEQFFNTGTITINNISNSSAVGIFNQDDFRNNLGGDIIIDSDIERGIYNFYGTFLNNGTIDIDNSNYGFSNSGALENIADATIHIDNTYDAFQNTSSGIITNYGELRAENAESRALINFGVIENYDMIHFYDTQSFAGVHNYPGGYISNFDYFIIRSACPRDLVNAGIITSHLGAYFSVDKQIDIESTGSFTNDGFMPSFYDGLHNVDAGGLFYNGGVIDDDFNSTDGAVTNLKVVVGRVAGTMTEGDPFPDVLDVVSATGLDFGDWKTDKGAAGVIAGTYNETTNEFTPNSAAVGLSTLYVSIEDVITGFTRNFTLEIDGGITNLPVVANPRSFQSNQSGNAIAAERAVDVFPNPSNGAIQIQSEIFEKAVSQIEVFNSTGQLVQQEEISQGDLNAGFNFSDRLSNGVYFIKIVQNGKLISTKPIYLQR